MWREMGQVSLDDILITEELSHRASRTPDLKAENDALRLLARQLVKQPRTMLKTLAAIAIDLCQAGTAGVSLLEVTAKGEEVFRWVALAGELEKYEQHAVPRHFSPCGTCLERQAPQLYCDPARYFTYLQTAQPAIVEGLVIPLMAANQPLGAIWIVAHDPQRQFDAEDVRVMTSLADFTAAALHNKRIEETLRSREAELSLVTNAVPVLISYIDCNQRYRFNNQTYEQWFGHPAREGYGKFLSEVLGPAAYPKIRPYVEQALAGKRVSFESEVPHPKGGTRHVSVTYIPRLDNQGTVEGFVALMSDISQRKRAERERERRLARERHHVSQLQGLTAASLAINSALSVEQVLQVITDQAASIIEAHQAATIMTPDWNWRQAITAVYLSDKYAQQWNGNTKPDWSGLYSWGNHLNCPMRMTQAELAAHPHWQGLGKQGETHPPMRGWLAVPLVGRDGENLGLIQLSDKFEGDFTEADEAILMQLAQMASVAVENARLYEAEQQARAAAEASREEAQAANRIKDEFLAVLSHELRSPLNPILGWSKLLLNRKLDQDKTQRAIATIARNAKLQAELIEDLLDISRILRGKLSLKKAPVDLGATIQAAMETVRLAAQAKSIQIQTQLDPAVGSVLGDAARIQQVLWNLLSNAVKFTPVGGRVEIRLERLGSQAQITVKDTGKGISPGFLPYIFDYFRQADSSTTRQFGGLGLGLAIAHHLVDLHGGTIRADSQGEGTGATFTVKLPLMPSRPETNQQAVELKPSLDLSGSEILLVEDDADTRELVSFLLRQKGARVIAVASASEGLKVLTQSRPDLLLSDIGMPRMDGYKLLEQVRNLPPERGGQIPAIALTAYAGDSDYQRAIAAGFQQHIPKPVEPMVLMKAITDLVKPAVNQAIESSSPTMAQPE